MLAISDLVMSKEMDKGAMAAVFGGLQRRAYSRLVNGPWKTIYYRTFIYRPKNGARILLRGYHAKYQRVQTLYRGVTYSG